MSWIDNDNNQIEQFLKTELDKHKIYPEEKVWNEIYKDLHGYKRWHALTIVTFIVITALTLTTLKFNNIVKLSLVSKNKKNIYYLNQINTTSANLISENILPKQKKFNSVNKEEMDLFQIINLPKKSIASVSKLAPSTYPLEKLNTSFNNSSFISNTSVNVNNQFNENTIGSLFFHTTNSKFVKLWANLLFAINTQPEGKFLTQNNLTKKENPVSINQTPISFNLNKPKQSKLEIQFYTTPSISYRKLKDDKSRNTINSRNINTPQPLPAIYYVDINDVVKHKPALGLEVGVGILYKVSPKIKLKTGLQFNARKYYIDSYKDGLNIAQIAVLTSNGLDTINQFATSSTTGISNKSLKNSLYQASVPLGIQWQLLKSNKFEISLEATLQPTLTLNKNVYLISTDYKYYTDGNSFFRKWNFNTSLEINFTYKVGNYNIFISPQARYQHLPTYTDKYPIKEYRLDNGLRIGFTKEIF